MTTATQVKNPQIPAWHTELDAIEQDARALVEGLRDEQMSWRPAEGAGRWSITQCLEHLAITGELLLHKLRPALDRAHREGRVGAGPFPYGAVGGWFVKAMERPGKRPMRAPKNFIPQGTLGREEVLQRFFAVQQLLRETLDMADGVRLDRIKVPSAAQGAGWLKLNAAAWVAATMAHQRRHLAQARAVKKSSEFPR